MNLMEECRALNDAELETALKFLADREKHNLARLLAHLAEYDRRQLCVKRGDSTLFFYCMRKLGFDEGGAYRRIRAARVVRRWPEVLELIDAGLLHLTALIVLHPILKDENRKELFRLAQGKSRRDLEMIVAERSPSPPQADFARRLPIAGGWTIGVSTPPFAGEALPSMPAVPDLSSPPSADGLHNAVDPSDSAEGASSVQAAAAQGAEPVYTGAVRPAPQPRPWEWQAMVPVAMDRVRIGFDAGLGVMRLIDRARQILRHKFPAGRLEDVVTEALETLLDRKDPQRKLVLKPAPVVRDAEPAAPRPRFLQDRAAGRYIPAWVKSAVWERDDGRCAFRYEDGTVCGSKDWTEYDHVTPVAKGGRSDTPRNIRLTCRLHNTSAAMAAGISGALPAS